MNIRPILISLLLVSALIPACSKDEALELTITSHRSGAVVSNPLPLKVRGEVKNFSSLPDERKKNLHVYLLEQGGGEKIWHIEPAVLVNSKGKWRGVTWLGNRRQGNRKNFTVCVFTSPEKLKLNNGNHPVKEKPENTGEACITLKRRDR